MGLANSVQSQGDPSWAPSDLWPIRGPEPLAHTGNPCERCKFDFSDLQSHASRILRLQDQICVEVGVFPDDLTMSIHGQSAQHHERPAHLRQNSNWPTDKRSIVLFLKCGFEEQSAVQSLFRVYEQVDAQGIICTSP